MIRKIKTTEYLKQYEAMTTEERKEYRSRVGAWLHDGGKRLIEMTDRPMAKAQNVVLLSARWTKEDSQAFLEGSLLLSALVEKADTWLPTQLYAKSAYRAVRQIYGCLAASLQDSGLQTIVRNGAPKGWQGGDAIASQKTKNNTTTSAAKPQVAVKADSGAQSSLASRLSPLTTVKGVPVRPRHIDQYVHLLPEKTQERAAQYGPLMRDMGAARENLRLLMDDPKASSASREQWAKVITKIDVQVKAIREELDREWAKLVEQGRVVVDELGQAHVVSPSPTLHEGEGAPDGKPSGTVAAVPDHAAMIAAAKERTPEQKKRLDQLKKFLRDRRLPEKNREEYVQKFREYHDEMVRDFGPEYFTQTMQENAKALGIEF